ncbi:GST N domain containing protein [Asbolus verrucosus]|uniref:glutathione transferase n=1 Tax=Asbolus verrucosus TaxID=1661398 RepID=A0A482VQX7_ASBVE|nr:GST N domain containing protein [Asbolus verrucosus]
MVPSYKLTYFATAGYAEPIRYLLSYGNIEFEDFRFKREEWPQLKEKMPFGHVPVLEHNGKKGCQSVAIARYVAKQVGLMGNDDWEDLEIDAIVDSIKENSTKLLPIRFETDEEKRKALRETAVKETLPYSLKPLEAFAQKNNGYLAVGRLTWADLYFVSLSEGINRLAGFDIMKDYPNLHALINKVLEIPSIRKWIETRPKIEP